MPSASHTIGRFLYFMYGSTKASLECWNEKLSSLRLKLSRNETEPVISSYKVIQIISMREDISISLNSEVFLK